MTGYIYCITNNINGKQYVGQTTHNVHERLKEHYKMSKQDFAEKRPLYHAMRQYGCNNFTIAVLAEVPPEDLNIAEQFWIAKLGTYGNGYNATIGGDGKRKYDTTFYQQFQKLYQEGLTVKEIAHKLCCATKTVRLVLKAEGYDTQHNAFTQMRQSVNQYTIDNQYIQSFPSIHDAASYLQQHGHNIKRTSLVTNISRAAKGQRKSCAGYIWKFE